MAKISVLFSFFALKETTEHFADIWTAESIQSVLVCACFFLAPEFKMKSLNSDFVAEQKWSSLNFASFNYSPKNCFFRQSIGNVNWFSACARGNCRGQEAQGLFGYLIRIFKAHFSGQTHLAKGKRTVIRKYFFYSWVLATLHLSLRGKISFENVKLLCIKAMSFSLNWWRSYWNCAHAVIGREGCERFALKCWQIMN